MKTQEVLAVAASHLARLKGRDFDVLTVTRPVSSAAAVNLAKVVSKLSPLVGNMIEFNTCEFLNDLEEFQGLGHWIRQDPGFPDTIFKSSIIPTPGFEIKAWFPLATEITARFKDSQRHFADNQTCVAMLAWLPEHLIFGKPKIIDIVVVPGGSVAKARDDHYHNPPDYLVLEPGNTAARTRNLRQTNTNGYKWQPADDSRLDARRKAAAAKIVKSWGVRGHEYSTEAAYQAKLRRLLGAFEYRLDTNFAKMDRIKHPELEAFKKRVYQTPFQGRDIQSWSQLLASDDTDKIATTLAKAFRIGEKSRRPAA